MTDDDTVILADVDGNILGDTHLFLREMLDGEDQTSGNVMTRNFVLSFLRIAGFGEVDLSDSEIEDMRNNYEIINESIVIKLPKNLSQFAT